MRVPLALNNLSHDDIERAIAVLRSGNLTMGENVREFEKSMAAYLKADHFIMVNSGSSANLVLIEALLRPAKGEPKLKPGDGVLVPSIAWPTTIWPLIQLGLKPLFVDVREDSFGIDLTKAALKIAESDIAVRAIFPIHPLGLGLNQTKLHEFVTKHNLILINDLCETLGSWQSGVHTGLTGLASTFSFYFSHHITTMEGGGIATNDSNLADDLKSIRSHGWSRDRSDKIRWESNLRNSDSKFLFVTTGYNVRPTEVQAAIGINQIKQINKFVSRRREISKQVANACANGPLNVVGAQYLSGEEQEIHSWMLIPILITNKNISREDVLDFFENRGIETRPVLTGNFLRQPAMQPFLDKEVEKSYPVTDWISRNCFVIGCHHEFSNAQVEFLVNTIIDFNESILTKLK